MPRAPRILVPGGIYHVTARGNRRQAVFADDRDHERFLALLGEVTDRLGWQCHSYCLMPNHYHAVVETPAGDISDGMRRLNSRYAQWFNWRYGLDGHLFQGRFHAVLVESDWHLLELSRYLALNPVRGGLCRLATEWRWSSYRALLELCPPPRFLATERVLDLFGRDPAAARRTFHRFVEEMHRAWSPT